jgi:hypothetical protein
MSYSLSRFRVGAALFLCFENSYRSTGENHPRLCLEEASLFLDIDPPHLVRLDFLFSEMFRTKHRRASSEMLKSRCRGIRKSCR